MCIYIYIDIHMCIYICVCMYSLLGPCNLHRLASSSFSLPTLVSGLLPNLPIFFSTSNPLTAPIPRQVVFMPGWSAFAESAEAAVGVEALNLVWPGTEPKASQGLEKIGFKRICSWDDVGMLGCGAGG